MFDKEATLQGTLSTNAKFNGCAESSNKASQVSSDCITFVCACERELTRRFKTMSVANFLAQMRDAMIAKTGSPNDKSLNFKSVQYSIYWEQHSCLRDGEIISCWERQVNENKFGNFFPMLISLSICRISSGKWLPLEQLMIMRSMLEVLTETNSQGMLTRWQALSQA